MRKTLIAVAVTGAFFVPALGHAQATPAAEPASPHTLTGNVTLASEYIYRGIAQTNRKPAIQGGFDYAHSSGVYLGTWASSISWLSDQSSLFPGTSGVSANMEWDFYGGYKGAFGGDFSYDVGLLQYYYPGRYPSGFVSPDTLEVYAGLGWKMLTLKYSHSTSNLFGFANSKGSGYLDLSGTFELAAGLNLVAHVGHQKVKNFGDASYTDWKLGITKDALGVTWGLAYVGTNAKGNAGQPYRNVFDKDLGKDALVLTVAKTF